MAATAITDEDSRLIEFINQGDNDAVTETLDKEGVNVNCHDKTGMTPLMHASFKGNPAIVKMLISRGADVNDNQQEHKYTPLMFATLSGSTETVQVLLNSGAMPSMINTINRTASQLGAFVGRHDCVALINNYLPKEAILYYTIPQGLEMNPKLKPHLAEPLHRFLLISTLHPVKLILFLMDNLCLMESQIDVRRVIELKCQSLYKQDMNELLALKLHHFGCVMRASADWFNGLTGKGGLDGFIKFLSQGRPTDGFCLRQEDLMRDSICSFPYLQSNTLQQLVRTLSAVKKGGNPTALEAMTQAIYGAHNDGGETRCFSCGNGEATRKCSKCKQAKYCDGRCQKYHWPCHKKQCYLLAEEHRELTDSKRSDDTTHT